MIFFIAGERPGFHEDAAPTGSAHSAFDENKPTNQPPVRTVNLHFQTLCFSDSGRAQVPLNNG
ncbi:hypothetical protein, partial [Streptomyces sp. NPDC060210]|uniref:hypothetical protein n=1 Tax=Streptomyces sp. NPDC060210 TaxID=3347074 RepID=UPI00365A3E43